MVVHSSHRGRYSCIIASHKLDLTWECRLVKPCKPLRLFFRKAAKAYLWIKIFGRYKVWDFFCVQTTLLHFRGPLKFQVCQVCFGCFFWGDSIAKLTNFACAMCLALALKAQSVLPRKRRSCRFNSSTGGGFGGRKLVHRIGSFWERWNGSTTTNSWGCWTTTSRCKNKNHQMWWFLRVLIGYDASCSWLYQ